MSGISLVIMSASGTKRTCRVALHMSAIGGKADITRVAYFCVYECDAIKTVRIAIFSFQGRARRLFSLKAVDVADQCNDPAPCKGFDVFGRYKYTH